MYLNVKGKAGTVDAGDTLVKLYNVYKFFRVMTNKCYCKSNLVSVTRDRLQYNRDYLFGT